MESTTKTILFVGGPWDGRREPDKNQARFAAPILPPRPTDLFVAEGDPRVPPPDFDSAIYTRRGFLAPEHTMMIFEGLQPPDVIRLLIEHYNPKPKIELATSVPPPSRLQ